MSKHPFSSKSVLSHLKDFQKRTVEFVFKRLFASNGSKRFLVADEVGLGKTLVAKGIIARTIEELQAKKERVDIIYICSNAVIASQNVNRLNVEESNCFTVSTRLTYLPRDVRSLQEKPVNFISLTPGTAFEHQKSRGGHMEERVILYGMLKDLPLAQNEKRKRLRRGLLNLLQATAGKDNWQKKATDISYEDLDKNISRNFRSAVRLDRDLYKLLKSGCEKFQRFRLNLPQEDIALRYEIIGKLRTKLAEVCLHELKPDLVILDEFQRFKELLTGDSDAAILAGALFNHTDARILLLSATPYKMLSLDSEMEDEDHYPDFINTLRFLTKNEEDLANTQQLIEERRKFLQDPFASHEQSLELRKQIEGQLLKVMCRTERVNATQSHNAMLTVMETPTPLSPNDLLHAKTADCVSRLIGAEEPIDYWKSVPYLLNFLRNYDLGRKLDDAAETSPPELMECLNQANGQLLRWSAIKKYRKLDPSNPKMREFLIGVLNPRLWRLLWMPPSLPYSVPEGVYKNVGPATKSLIFSSWVAVPNAISAIVSYEAEQRLMSKLRIEQNQVHKKIKPLLRYARSVDGRLTGMPVLACMMPSPTLAIAIDPLRMALQMGQGKPVGIQELIQEATKKVETLLHHLPPGKSGPIADRRWYWAAPVMLDAHSNLINWCRDEIQGWASAVSREERGLRFQEHIDFLLEVAEGRVGLGPRPANLAKVLAEMALAAPGTCALRSLCRIEPGLKPDHPLLLSGAAQIAEGFRSLYNQPESIALIRGQKEGSYCWKILHYGLKGNIQAMLDEHIHTLVESLGVQEHSTESRINSIAITLYGSLSLRSASLKIDEIRPSRRRFQIGHFTVRCRFALRFGNIIEDKSATLIRSDSVREAFNSPFHPFVLASTSIGQEGLDFHTWCHSVVHWNLPSNPVDLEQREGRVHRYKGHAIRKNIAEKYGLKALLDWDGKGDPWNRLFDLAVRDRDPNACDLIPYWIFEEGKARIERRILLLPYSKEGIRLKQLKRWLTLYRLVFGQPRQEELLDFIDKNKEIGEDLIRDYCICLEPPNGEKHE